MQSPFRSCRSGSACVFLLTGSLLSAAQSHAQTNEPTAADAKGARLETVLVVAQRADRVSNGATNLDLDIKDTPQSISVITQEQMQQFGAHSVNDALRLATGIQVDEWETNRTSYSARGFDILNTQVDGVGMPNNWGIATGKLDTYGFEKVEVIRGANGLLTGVGNAAATVNYVRKRPTNEAQGEAGISYGRWNTKRLQADYSTPFTTDETWAGRVVVAHEDGDSYLHENENRRDYLYGVVDGQIGDDGTLTVGFSYQKSRSDGVMWGALPWTYSDGTQAVWHNRSTTTTQDWTYWNTANQNGFVEYAHRLTDDWQLKLTYNYRRTTNNDALYFAYDANSTGLDPVTGAGLAGYPWSGRDETTANLSAVTLDGHFELFGLDQEAILGVSYAESHEKDWDKNAPDADDPEPAAAWTPPTEFPYDTNAFPEPDWEAATVASDLDQRVKRAFGATHLALTERLKAIIGASYAEYHRDGTSYGAYSNQTKSHTSPYGGLTFDFTVNVLGYVSYSDIYQPQDQSNANNEVLKASKGENYEVGVKADWLDKRLLTTLAVFKSQQEGLATQTGQYNEFNQAIYQGVDVTSKGVELEATGQVSDNLALMFGYTALKLDGQDGDDTYSWVPRHTAKLIVIAHVPSYTALSFGLGGRWQDEISNTESDGFTVRQDSYAVFNGFAAWDFLPDATLRLNVDNIGDKKYINTLRFSGYYDEPRNYTVSLNWKF